MDKVSTTEDTAVDTTGTDDELDLSAEDTTSSTDTDDISADTLDDDTTSDDEDQPSDSADDAADDTTTSTDTKTPAFDKDLDDWAEKAGLGKPETDRERRAVQVARDHQRNYSKRAEAAASAKKLAEGISKTAKQETSDDIDPLAKDVALLKNELTTERQNRQVSEFVYAMSESGTPVSTAEIDAMSKLIAQTAETDGQAGVNFLLKDIGRWHKLAAMELGTDKSDTDAVAEKARKEERARIAKQQQAAGPNRSAKATIAAKGKDELTKIWEDDSI